MRGLMAAVGEIPKPNITCNLIVGCDGLHPILGAIATFLITVAGGLFFLMFIFGAIQYLAGAGQPDQTGKAKSTMLNAVVGMIVVTGSWAILNFIVSELT